MPVGASRPAVSQHLEVLKRAGLVRVEPRGMRRHECWARPGGSRAEADQILTSMKAVHFNWRGAD